MARETPALINFNRGVISKKALARTDIDRVQSSAEIQENWMPSELGPMQFRPGTKYLRANVDGTVLSAYIPFVFSTDERYICEINNDTFLLLDDEGAQVQIDVNPGLTQLTNTDFTSAGGGWTNISDAGGGIDQTVTIDRVPVLQVSNTLWALFGNRYNAGRIEQGVAYDLTVSGAQNIYFEVRVARNFEPITMYVADATGGIPTLLEKTSLEPGVHLIGVPFPAASGTAYVTFEYFGDGRAVIDYCAIHAGGNVNFSTSTLKFDPTVDQRGLRHVQSGDVVYMANYPDYDKDLEFPSSGSSPVDRTIQAKIERRDRQSWSVVQYLPRNGPFGLINTSTVTMTYSALSQGVIEIEPSEPIFTNNMVGQLLKIDSVGQAQSANLNGDNQFTGEIRVTGADSSRQFVITRSGVWVGTLTLQRSVGVTGAWEDVTTYTGNGTTNFNDNFDDLIVYYRIGFKTGGYTSGTATVSLTYPNGSQTGVARVIFVDHKTAITDLKIAYCVVLQAFGPSTPSENWYVGQWGYPGGFPSAPELQEGRLWWAGAFRVWGSISDAYESFDEDFAGDAGPINRTIGYGPVERIRWLKGLERLYIGGQTAEHVIKSSSFDEPVTPTDFSLKQASTVGSADVDAVRVDQSLLFVQRGGKRLYEMNLGQGDLNPVSTDLTMLCPELFDARIKQIVVVRKPETRVFCVMEDGTACVLVYNRLEEVRAWVPLTLADGLTIEHAFMLPSDDAGEDGLFLQVRVSDALLKNGNRYNLLKFAADSECIGEALSKNVDMFSEYTGVATSAIGLTHLPAGTEVAVWADGMARDTVDTNGSFGADVSGAAATNIVAGLPYQARYKSVKMAYGATPGGTALLQRKRISSIGMLLMNTHKSGIKYGPDFDHLDDLPQIDDRAPNGVQPEVYEDHDRDSFEFDGEWDTDSRICMVAESPKPATVLAVVAVVNTNEKD